ncbi:MAG: metallophosphoesterase [Polyangiaceae bacterium]|nr:metallophosphoesterase [Polyangiaceae bacterium]
MRIAHLSDPHVRGEAPEPWTAYANKRATGWVNLKLKRHASHKHEVLQALLREVARRRPDHVVITGDFSNLAFEGELVRARELIDRELGLPADQVNGVPGNPDLYTAGSARRRRFLGVFGDYMTSDLPGISAAHASGPFPFVRLRGDAALIGLSSATPRPPMIASGLVGRPQREALARVLGRDELRGKVPLVLVHHPLHPLRTRVRTFTNGLSDAAAMRGLLRQAEGAVVLHGHLHERVQIDLGGGLRSIGATSASLLHDDDDRRAGFNVYELEGGAFVREHAVVLDAATGRFDERAIPSGPPVTA